MSVTFKKLSLAALTLAMGFSLTVGANAQDARKGKRVWMKCQICHQIKPNARKSTGPNLYGIFDRAAGAQEGFKYSKVMKAKAADGLVWTEENIRAFAANPRKYMKGTKMAFAGVKKAKDMNNLIAYMRQENAK